MSTLRCLLWLLRFIGAILGTNVRVSVSVAITAILRLIALSKGWTWTPASLYDRTNLTVVYIRKLIAEPLN